MPLKHHTETAYLFLLGLAIGVSGVAVALLPKLPNGFPYWLVLFIAAVFYPLVLARTFRTNRADYEFRLLHWFPAGIFMLWILLEALSPKFRAVYILELGFLYLWSLPLVALGIAFIILFAVHVIRRNRLRVTVLSIMLAAFCIGAIAAEATGVNEKLQAALFPKNTAHLVASVKSGFARLAGLIYRPDDQSGALIVASQGSSAGMKNSSRSAIAMMPSSARSTMVISSRPRRLPKSGPESAALLFTLVAGAYCALLQKRTADRR